MPFKARFPAQEATPPAAEAIDTATTPPESGASGATPLAPFVATSGSSSTRPSGVSPGSIQAEHVPETTTETPSGLPPETEEALRKVAAENKAEGNRLYGEGKHAEAEESYTRAITLCEPLGAELSVFFANRAQCRMKLKRYSEAV